MDPIVYVISDIHVGAGYDAHTNNWNVLEDFRSDNLLCRFIDHISNSKQPVELVIAGDFIEYLQILPEIGLRSPADHLGATEAESLERTKVMLGLRPDIASGHPQVFNRLRNFLQDGNNLTIIVGNHDVDLLWPGVWQLLSENLQPSATLGILSRKEFCYVVGNADRGRVHIEHGHERDRANCFGNQMKEPFAWDEHGKQRLKRNWGSLFVDRVVNLLEPKYQFVDNFKPILRFIKLGIQNDFKFTAKAMALVVKFFLANPLIPVLGPGDLKQQSCESLVKSVQEPEIQAYIQQRLGESSFRQDFEAELANPTDLEIWANMQVEVQSQSLFEEHSSNGPAVLGWLQKESPYQSAAREIMEKDPTIGTVVMGHTHCPVCEPINLKKGCLGYYFNTGTWMSHLCDTSNRTYSWEEISNIENYILSLNYVCLTPNPLGEYQAELRSWGQEVRECLQS